MSNQTLSDIINCLAGYDPEALPVEHAQHIIREYIQPINDTETVDLRHSLNRVLAQELISPISVPAHDNAAMDGYAFHGSDLLDGAPTVLKLVGSRLAGESEAIQVCRNECIRIMTGAVMPDGCDTVVPQELASDGNGNYIVIPAGVMSAGDNRRHKGEDLENGKPALPKGRILRPADIGLVASLGLASVTVHRRLRVAIFSTGDELRSIGEPLTAGSVYDSNRYTLDAMLTRLGCDVIDLGVVRDEPALLEATFRDACDRADVVITSGGVSVGAADYTKQVMSEIGDITFWKIGMRPGRPMAFGRLHSGERRALLFGLPGNPVAVMVTFYFFVRDALLRMMGAANEPLPLVRAKSVSAIRKKAGRTEYQRGILSRNVGGDLQVRITGSQGSGILRSMSEANCMIVLSHQQGTIEAGDSVDVVLFDGLI